MTSARESAMRSPDRFMARGLAEEVGDENPRHGGPTGRADARPIRGSAKRSMGREARLDCFVACASRNDRRGNTAAGGERDAEAKRGREAAGPAESAPDQPGER